MPARRNMGNVVASGFKWKHAPAGFCAEAFPFASTYTVLSALWNAFLVCPKVLPKCSGGTEEHFGSKWLHRGTPSAGTGARAPGCPAYYHIASCLAREALTTTTTIAFWKRGTRR